MAVPTEGKFKMFDPEDPESIEGAISSTNVDVSNTNDFNGLIKLSDLNYFDPQYAGNLWSLNDVSESIQYRNYPILPGAESCPYFTVTEINNPESGNVTFVVYPRSPLSPSAIASITVNGTTVNDSITVTNILGITLKATGSLQTLTAENNPSVIIGWSLDTTIDNLLNPTDIVSSTSTINGANTISKEFLTHTIERDETYYLIIDYSTPIISQSYCYTTSNTLNDICLVCNNPTLIYFSETDFNTNGPEGATWYDSPQLTTYPPPGYYYLSGSISPIIYNVTSGSATWYGTCKSGLIYCS